MDFDTVRTFIDYILPYWNMNPNPKKIVFGFYGGEPLLNFPLIDKTVKYCKSLESNNLTFNFSRINDIKRKKIIPPKRIGRYFLLQSQ